MFPTTFSSPLLPVKRDHGNMQQIYTETVNLEMENLPPFVEQGVIEFLPHVGHCLCLRSWLPEGKPMTADAVTIAGLELKVSFHFFFVSEFSSIIIPSN